MALLLLDAANKVRESAAFNTAVSHLLLAYSLFGNRHWKDEYDLSLDLFDTAAEVKYYNGRLNSMDELINEILQSKFICWRLVRIYLHL